jgi:hypothetical protein
MKPRTATTGRAEPTMFRTSWKSSKKFEDFQKNPLDKHPKTCYNKDTKTERN